MLWLNPDILYNIVEHFAPLDSKSSREVLLSLAPVCRAVNESIRSHLFATVHWPHPNKHEEQAGLLFFPEVLWPFFRTFYLDWPDHWPDTSPPKWGEKPALSVYYPKHLDKLEDALPNMLNVHTFQLTCPFDPPTKLLRAIVGCSNIKNLKIIDTPLYTPILPTVPSTFVLESLTLTSVGEAARLGEAPYEKRFQNITYFMRGYRKKYFDFSDAALMGRVFAAQRFVTTFCRPETLRYFVFSAAFMSVDELSNADVSWPLLETLVLTGPPPLQEPIMSELVARMPRLADLRILLSTLARSNGPQRSFTLALPAPVDPAASPTHTGDPKAYMQLTSLALSNAYNSQGVLRYTPHLARLAMCAIISPPRMSIALRRNEIEDLLSDLEAGGGSLTLRHLRLISEEELDATFFAKLGVMCPALEIVEVERCGYQDAQDSSDWPDWGDAFSEFKCLRNLRFAMPFLGCEELKHEHEQRSDRISPACVRAFRKPFAEYLATRVLTLQRIGLEYRWRSMQRYEDRWLDFDIVRLRNREVTLIELGPSWYRFPEVYEPESLHDS